MRKLRRILILVFALLILVLLNYQIYQKERLLSEGTMVLLELAPRDPRSLMQGDYMVLRYQIAQRQELRDTPVNYGYIVLELDKNQVAYFKRLYDETIPLQPNELILRFRKRDQVISFGAESFFFQEGHAQYYAQARYGELRLAKNGESVLVGLRNTRFNRITPLSEHGEL
jgi:uncharacterized membrane-anchored protein